MRKSILLLAVLGLSGCLLAADQMGTWKLNLAKSKVPPSSSNTKDTVLVFREIDGTIVEGSSTETRTDGSVVTSKWTTPKSGGIQTYQQGGPTTPGLSSVAVRVDENTMHNVYLLNGAQVGLIKISFSKDGKTFTMGGTARDTEGKSFEYLALFEKQ
jgi:hypothetical protein